VRPPLHHTLIGELNDEALANLLESVEGWTEAPMVLGGAGQTYSLSVCSPGGDCHVYGAIVDLLSPIADAGLLQTIALGQCCSGAPLIVASGNKGQRYSYRNTSWMLHEPYRAEFTEDSGAQAAEIRDLESTRDRYYNLLCEFTGRTRRFWRHRVQGKSLYFFDAKEAKRCGLVDEVI
jgi:ATP-dependent Clp protease protease subunit